MTLDSFTMGLILIRSAMTLVHGSLEALCMGSHRLQAHTGHTQRMALCKLGIVPRGVNFWSWAIFTRATAGTAHMLGRATTPIVSKAPLSIALAKKAPSAIATSSHYNL